ncbi:MAG: hypothetical protein HN341_02160 [Verrucomicrobia bacterium]|nr:hypothetical protein [Verrucomicrobiota bacterium]
MLLNANKRSLSHDTTAMSAVRTLPPAVFDRSSTNEMSCPERTDSRKTGRLLLSLCVILIALAPIVGCQRRYRSSLPVSMLIAVDDGRPGLLATPLTEAQGMARIDELVAGLTTPGQPYAGLFGQQQSTLTKGSPLPGIKVLVRVFSRGVPITRGGQRVTLIQIGRVSIELSTGFSGAAVGEAIFPGGAGVAGWGGGQGPAAPWKPVPATRAPAGGGSRGVAQLPGTGVQGPTTVLVVTNLTILRSKHPAAFNQLHAYLKRLGTIYDTSREGQNANSIRKKIRSRLKKRHNNSIFIFGNGDVVPFVTRKNPCYGKNGDKDAIFGDDFYGDTDKDALCLPDMDVGRIPDDPDIINNPSSVLYRVQESRQPLRLRSLGCVANFRRPTADDLVGLVNPARSGQNFFWSEPYALGNIPRGFYRGGGLYLILHGGPDDGSQYTGEPKIKGRKYPPAFSAAAAEQAEVVMSGACYGAKVMGRTTSNSIALACMAKGCRAFIGHSGMSYSNFSSMARGQAGFYKLFIEASKKGMPPATAFRVAKHSLAAKLTTNSDRKHLAQLIYYGLPPVQLDQAELTAMREAAAKAARKAAERAAAQRAADARARQRAAQHQQRRTHTPSQTTFTAVTVNQRNIHLQVWDSGSIIDGDEVLIYLNGDRNRGRRVRLVRNRTSIPLNLPRSGRYRVTVEALNEGTSKPNTASIHITGVAQGRATQKWSLKTGQRKDLWITANLR